MIKLFSLLNLAGLFLFDLFFLSDISITQDAPATMAPNSEVKVTVTINKDQVSGFAKLQIDLPEGLSASAIETKGASFTFAEGKAKFIWMALPSQPQFKVSYTLSASAAATGSLPITGKFSYIEDNERKTKDLAPSTVTITGGAMAQDASTPTPTEPANANDLATAAGAAPAAALDVALSTAAIAPMQGAGGVSAKRTITPLSATEMLVEVTVSKGALRGFGKLQETLPAGFSAVEKSSSEAIFTAQDRIAKFVWLNLPAQNELKVSYELRANGQPEGEYTVNGEFGYLLNDETQKAVVGSTTFFTGARALQALQPQVAAVTPTPAPVSAPKTEQPKAEPKPATEPVTAQAQRPKTTTRIPTPETGVTYKVQISAAHREVGSPYFVERHHYSGDFSIERHEGWIKYVTGRFTEYRAARDTRQSYIAANYNFPGPFVTAYNNGERITVQEALMISNQKWAQ
ncbi:MAG: hypothetical protein JST66_03095 [Bacteroidetes bacterium]|nr:hypothetical protein [Bacteroidota bacterium]